MSSDGLESPTLFDADDVGPGQLGPTTRVRMLVAYHGAPFHGFAANAGVRTVGGSLADALAKVLGHRVELTVAGRTDKGVHAWGNVVSFDARTEGLDLERLQHALNRILQPHVAVREAVAVGDDFNARFSATARTYRYTVVNRTAPDPFLADRAWFVDDPIDLAVLRLSCDPFLGTHDFSSFCRRPKRADGTAADLHRRVERATWSEVDEGILRFEIRANAFCHQMVRSVVGFMVDVGTGRRSVGEIAAVLRARDRTLAGGRLAPPQGLVMWEVDYGRPHLRLHPAGP